MVFFSYFTKEIFIKKTKRHIILYSKFYLSLSNFMYITILKKDWKTVVSNILEDVLEIKKE